MLMMPTWFAAELAGCHLTRLPIFDLVKMSYVPLKGFTDTHEILNKYPFTIRRKGTHRVLKDSKHNEGYLTVNLNGVNYLKHVIIAKQFLPNDDPTHKKEVDHKNRNRADNRLSNLRWVTHSENNYNRVMPKTTT